MGHEIIHEAEEAIRTKEHQLTADRRRILAKLSPEDQDELAHIDHEWDNLKALKARRAVSQ